MEFTVTKNNNYEFINKKYSSHNGRSVTIRSIVTIAGKLRHDIKHEKFILLPIYVYYATLNKK